MNCPYCGVEHKPESGRFCEKCGMSVYRYVKREEDEDEHEAEQVRCRFCGSLSPPPTCMECGTRLLSADE